MPPIKRNCIQTFQLRSNYTGIPFVIALIGALFVVIAYALNKHHAWNAFSKHPVALGGCVVGVFVLSIIGSLLQRRYDQKQLLAYLSRDVRPNEILYTSDIEEDIKNQNRYLSPALAEKIAHMSLREAKKQFQTCCDYFTSFDIPILKALIEKGVPPDFPRPRSTTALCTLLGSLLTELHKDRGFFEFGENSVTHMVAFLLERGANVNGLSAKENKYYNEYTHENNFAYEYTYESGKDAPLLTISFMNYLPYKYEIIELMLNYRPDLKNVRIQYLLGFLFYKNISTDIYIGGFRNSRELFISSLENRNPSEEEINQTMNLLERIIAEGAPYMQTEDTSTLLELAEKISVSQYPPCKSRVLQAIVNGATKKQKAEQDQFRSTLLATTNISQDMIPLILEYAIDLPKLVVSALNDKKFEEEYEG